MSKAEQEKAGKFIDEYLKLRKEIALIIFLIDIRHTPTANDRLMYNYIVATGFPSIIIANKSDKIAPTKVDAAATEMQNLLNPLKDITFLPFSSEKKIYCDKVWAEIEKYIK